MTATASPAARTTALLGALADKDLLDPAMLGQIEAMVESWRPQNGAHVVARAWTDPAYRARLVADGTAACAELGYGGPQGEYIVVLENTPTLHNVVVCTLCSCTPWPIMGLPRDWYKSPAYRSRITREPQAVLREMGLDLPADVKLRVWDTTAETRYMVLPMRPAGTEAYSEAELAALVTYETMVGVALPTV
ncbi:nitrile hydratase subunit alpha [Sandarakinorhabdus sp.]|uniref:nitrile hydratase subunit alpha n=1 Tax=Sandarakinorhabdus sp. TaxID=1916663 RepID=UPI00286EAB49|nr:nitrile hydratase subunit alpha [Sandarakinorhabdus sp.]